MSKPKEDGYEARERLGDPYWNDPRWKEVQRLRTEGKVPESNGVVFDIRESWGVE